MKKILFSPIGTTDPIRDCNDGACLHIIRHYHPDKVVLFFTKEMEEREAANHCYTLAIKHIAPDCEITCINSGIKDAHIYDRFIEIIPREINNLKSDENEIILNLSSGTPQIKTMMAIMAVQEDLRAVQVASPQKASNSNSHPVQYGDDVEAMIENNLDDEPNAENRCTEPPIQVIRYFGERQQILSLVKSYEYNAAYMLAKHSAHMPDEAKKLLKFLALRSQLRLAEAKKVFTAIDGIRLFPFDTKNNRGNSSLENIMEYLLLLLIDQKKGRLNDMLVKGNNVLIEILSLYVKRFLSLEKCIENKKLSRSRLKEYNMSGVLEKLDEAWSDCGGYKDAEWSVKNLAAICTYMVEQGIDTDNCTRIAELLQKIDKEQLMRARNTSAHTIINISENDFSNKFRISSWEFINILVKVAAVVIDNKVLKFVTMYDSLNTCLEQKL